MKIKLKKLNALHREITVQNKLEDMSSNLKIAAQKIQPKVNLDGFRKGKVPLDIIKEKYYDFLHDQVIKDMVSDFLSEAIKIKNIRLAGYPNIKDIQDKNGKLSFSAVFEVQPELKLKPIKKQKFMLFRSEISDQDVDQQIQNMRNQYKTWEIDEDENSMIQKSVKVHCSLKAYSIENLEIVQFEQENLEFEFGSGMMFKEIEDRLINAKINEQIEINFVFPQSHYDKKLAGQEFIFKILVKQLFKAKLPALDEKLFAKIKTNSLVEFREKIQKGISKSLKEHLYELNRSFILDEINKISEFEIPQTILEQELKALKKNSKLSEEKLKDLAIKRIRIGYIMADIIEKNELEIGENVVEEFLKKETQSTQEFKKAIDEIYQNDNQLKNLKNYLLEKQAIELIMETAKINYQDKTYQEVMEYQNDKK